MFGVISVAADLGFPVFLILTTDNVILQQQTIERVREDLDGFCICDEYDSEIFAENCLMQPVIIVLKKNVRTLKQWSNILGSTGFMRGNPLFIIDDEADAASLNTLINKKGQSSINKYLDSIRSGASSSLYLQVTGTPQAIFLQTMVSGWHPLFTYYFNPGNGYLGGDFFFPKSGSGSWRFDIPGKDGGNLRLPLGDYAFITINDDTSVIFENDKSFSSIVTGIDIVDGPMLQNTIVFPSLIGVISPI